jgi:hypothetical protein
MAWYDFERPINFAEGFLRPRHGPLPWPVGVQEDYDVHFHFDETTADEPPADEPRADGPSADEPSAQPASRPQLQRVTPRLKWGRQARP